jgi:type II secretory pathway component GspD/PulD (secretin)
LATQGEESVSRLGKRRDGFRRGAGRAIALVLLFPAILLSFPHGQILAQDSYDEQRAEQFVHRLIDEQRYPEAISYLQSELRSTPAGVARQKLQLLLADCQLEIGDHIGASSTLAQVDTSAADRSIRKAVAERTERLSEMESQEPRPARYGMTGDSLEAPAPPITSDMTQQPLVTNSFFETDLRQALTDLSLQTGVPIIVDATVQGMVTYQAVNQPLDEVLGAIVEPAGYAFSLVNGRYYVGSSKPDDPSFGLLSKTAVVTLSSIDPVEAVSLLSDHFKPFVKASKSANMVCVTAPPTTLARILKDIEALDRPPLQVLLEVVVTEISTDALRKMGLDWRLSHSTDKSSWEVGTDHTNISGASLLAKYAGTSLSIADHAVDLATSLEMLLDTGQAKIRANPRITTLNGRTAQIGLTKDQYFIIATSASQYYQYNTLQSISSGIKLEITPYASDSGTVTVYVKPEVGDVIGSGREGLPEITKRTASTSVRVRDGETFAVGGLDIQNDKAVQRKVPLLGSIPLLGYFFRYDERQVTDTEIVIFVTPHIIREEGGAE